MLMLLFFFSLFEASALSYAIAAAMPEALWRRYSAVAESEAALFADFYR